MTLPPFEDLPLEVELLNHHVSMPSIKTADAPASKSGLTVAFRNVEPDCAGHCPEPETVIAKLQNLSGYRLDRASDLDSGEIVWVVNDAPKNLTNFFEAARKSGQSWNPYFEEGGSRLVFDSLNI